MSKKETPPESNGDNVKPISSKPKSFNLDKGDTPVAPFSGMGYGRSPIIAAAANKAAADIWTSNTSYNEYLNALRHNNLGRYDPSDYFGHTPEERSPLVNENVQYYDAGKLNEKINDFFSVSIYDSVITSLILKLKAGERKYGIDSIIDAQGKQNIIEYIILPHSLASKNYSSYRFLHSSTNQYKEAIVNGVLSDADITIIHQLLDFIPAMRKANAAVEASNVSRTSWAEAVSKPKVFAEYASKVELGAAAYAYVESLFEACSKMVSYEIAEIFLTKQDTISHYSEINRMEQASTKLRDVACAFIADDVGLAGLLEGIVNYRNGVRNVCSKMQLALSEYFYFFNKNSISFKEIVAEALETAKKENHELPW